MESKGFRYRRRLPSKMIPNKLTTFKKYNQVNYKRPMPSEYKKAAKALQFLEKQNIPIENTINPGSSLFVDKEAYYLTQKTLKRMDQINYMLEKLEVFKANKILNPWLAKVLVAEMLYCKHQYARSSANDVETMKFYEESMRDMFVETQALVPYHSDVKLPVYIRINILSISIDDCIRAFFKEGWNLLPRSETYDDYLTELRHLEDKNFMRDFHISELLVFPPDTIFYNHPGYLRGKFLIQDKGSCLSSFLLNPKPGSVVLDINAAPGLKTNHLANIMNNEGLIIANDEHPLRNENLGKLIDLTNVKCVQTCQTDHFEIANSIPDPEDIKYILIDPTCTYSGLFFKIPKNSSKVRLHKLQFRLCMLLRYCLQTFPNLKRLVFTTCSIYPEEGEKVVNDTLQEIGNSYSLLNVKEMLWNEWKSINEDNEYEYNQFEFSEKCLRTIPERDLTPGYFIAVFERNFDVPVPPYVRKYKRGSKTYNADEFVKVEKVKPSGKVIQTYIPKEKLDAPQKAPIKKKNESIFSKVKEIVQYQNKVEKAAFIKNKMNQPPGNNKYKYVSNDYKSKQQQQILQKPQKQQHLPQETSQTFSQQNPKPFVKSKPVVPTKPALVSYPILNKLKEQQFAPQLQYSQPNPQVQYSQQQLEPQCSQSKTLVQYPQPKLQSHFSKSLRHQQLGLVSYPILNKLMSSNNYCDDKKEDECETTANQLYP